MLTSKACLMTMLFSKVLFAKMTEPGTADILSLSSITFEKMKTSETLMCLFWTQIMEILKYFPYLFLATHFKAESSTIIHDYFQDINNIPLLVSLALRDSSFELQ